MDLKTITETAITPALALLPATMDTPAARVMLLAIGLQEGRFMHRRQIGGPARGFWQFEKGTRASRGGVWGVFLHAASRDHLATLCKWRGCCCGPTRRRCRRSVTLMPAGRCTCAPGGRASRTRRPGRISTARPPRRCSRESVLEDGRALDRWRYGGDGAGRRRAAVRLAPGGRRRCQGARPRRGGAARHHRSLPTGERPCRCSIPWCRPGARGCENWPGCCPC